MLLHLLSISLFAARPLEGQEGAEAGFKWGGEEQIYNVLRSLNLCEQNKK